MNGIHDMGGMHGMGPIVRDPNEAPFHEPWEGRARALGQVMRPFRPNRPRPSFRYVHETVPPVDYLRMSYYERIFHVFVLGLLEDKTITATELASGAPDPDSPRETPRVTPALAAERMAETASPSLRRDDVQARARFDVGQSVQVRNLHPVGHTRLPRYLRGKRGVVLRDHGVFDLQDTDADGYTRTRAPQHVYTVRFEARELWGDEANRRDTLFAELWEDYLERP